MINVQDVVALVFTTLTNDGIVGGGSPVLTTLVQGIPTTAVARPYGRIDSVDERNGIRSNDSDLFNGRFTLHIFANTPETCSSILKQVVASIDELSGTISDGYLLEIWKDGTRYMEEGLYYHATQDFACQARNPR